MMTDESPEDDWLASAILAAAGEASVGIMLTTANPELHNVFANRCVESLLGYSHDELLGLDPMTILTGSERARLDGAAKSFASRGEVPTTVETTVLRRNGTSVSVELGLGSTTLEDHPGVVAFIADVTPRRLALESLERSEARFRSVVESIPEAVLITEGTKLTYANRAFTDLTGIEASRENPPDVIDLIPEEDAPRLREQLACLREQPLSQLECRMAMRDSKEHTLELSSIGIEFDDRPTVLWLGQDVTRRKLLEAQILQADRLAVLGTLAAGMAHAINNPLSYTLLNLEHVARRMRDLATEHDYYAEARVRLAEAHDGADRVAKTVRQMRTLSRSRPSAPGPVDVRAVLENVLVMIGNEIRYRGQLVTRYEPAPHVWASDGELEQAFLGLLLYVARSRPEEVSLSREIRLCVAKHDDGGTVVTVSEDGPQLDPEIRGRLFDPFATGEAMGLGLAMCHAIFTALGGRMDVESGSTGGTIFRVVLPAVQHGDASQPGTIRVTQPTLPPENLPARARVLVIDDDPGVANTLRVMLEAHHEVTSVEHATEGLRLLLREREFDVVFCDLVMPELSGIDLYRALELNHSTQLERIVFMTGGVFTTDAERFLARVPNARIEKPFSLARIEQILAQTAGRR